MVDCWMSLNVPYAIELAKTCADQGIDIHWWEECLHPGDMDGHKKVRRSTEIGFGVAIYLMTLCFLVERGSANYQMDHW